MIFTQFAEEVHKGIRERMNDLADHIAGGGVESFEAYKHVTGEIAGLAYAETMLLAAVKRLEGEDGNHG